MVVITIFIACKSDFVSDMLEAHNNIRRELNISELTWSKDLSLSAQSWSNHLAINNLRQHSGMPDLNENIARGTPGSYDPLKLFFLWVAERQFYIPGQIYPNVSTTGRSGDVGHYTQIVWRTTTEVGCGFSVAQRAVLVCHYKKSGNILGRPVY